MPSFNMPQLIPLHHTSNDWQAASLMIIIQNHLLFIKRSMNMPTFKGHVAFIGGMRKSEEFATQLCLREFEEETMLAANYLSILAIIQNIMI